ncbi:hypothetical protein AV530_007514 [Patagioenas fasciata monilis]|uniref:Uncharacterized protein n=1 Tax=Patagioenas fasciata monilis TaxID=372326 RepID=A0A1V4JYC4_PATFA|nr:hypothetical protein AV530_007514 [Patagioenas fasciata monilis]
MAAVKLSQEVHDLFIFQTLESCVTPDIEKFKGQYFHKTPEACEDNFGIWSEESVVRHGNGALPIGQGGGGPLQNRGYGPYRMEQERFSVKLQDRAQTATAGRFSSVHSSGSRQRQ